MNCLLKNEFVLYLPLQSASEWPQNYQHAGNEDHCGNLLRRGVILFKAKCIYKNIYIKINAYLITIQIFVLFLGTKIASTFRVNWKKVHTLFILLVIWWSLWACVLIWSFSHSLFLCSVIRQIVKTSGGRTRPLVQRFWNSHTRFNTWRTRTRNSKKN